MEDLQNPIISVIIPVYNAQNYLPECLDSVKNQSFLNFEVLLVDDCSSDDSLTVCEKYAAGDQRFKIFRHSVNRGPGAARNTAIDNACGETIFFLDADDFLEPDTLAVLNTLWLEESADICIGKFNYYHSEGLLNTPFTFPDERYVLSVAEICLEIQKNMNAPNREFLFAYAWGKLFRREIIESFKIRFSENMKMFEDLKFLYQFASYSQKIAFIPETVYNYRIPVTENNLSMCISKQHNRLLDIFAFYKEMRCFSKSANLTMTHADNCLINLSIVHIVRYCNKMNIKNFLLVYQHVKALVVQPGFIDAIRNYDSNPPGRSKMMPFFMRHKMVIPLLLIGKYKAWKRYGKEK